MNTNRTKTEQGGVGSPSTETEILRLESVRRQAVYLNLFFFSSFFCTSRVTTYSTPYTADGHLCIDRLSRLGREPFAGHA